MKKFKALFLYVTQCVDGKEHLSFQMTFSHLSIYSIFFLIAATIAGLVCNGQNAVEMMNNIFLEKLNGDNIPNRSLI